MANAAWAQITVAPPPPLQPESKTPAATGAVKKNNAPPAEAVDKVIIESAPDPENVKKKKKTIEEILDSLLNTDDKTSGITNTGTRYECVKNCRGPFCCAYSGPARTYSSPDSEHK